MDKKENANSKVPETDVEAFIKTYSTSEYKNSERKETQKFMDGIDTIKGSKYNFSYIDSYYNFYGVMAPRVEIYFKNGKDWVDISTINGKLENGIRQKNFNNNFFVSANIEDKGARKLSLTLFDKSFYTLQYLIFNAIKSTGAATATDKDIDKSTDKTQEVEIQNEKGEVATTLNFKVSPDTIVNNLKIVWGYTDANPSYSQTKNLTNQNYFNFKNTDSESRSNARWNDRISDKSVIVPEDGGGPISKGGYEKVLGEKNQTTIRSQEEEFFITDVKSTLTNTGMQYTINAVGADSFILNSYKFVQMYASLRGTPKDLMAYFMKTFNESKDPLIKVCWNDSKNILNGSEYVKDFSTGEYVKKTEELANEEMSKAQKRIDALKRRKEILVNTIATVEKNDSNTISDCFGGRNIFYDLAVNDDSNGFSFHTEKQDIFDISQEAINNNRGIFSNKIENCSLLVNSLSNRFSDYKPYKKKNEENKATAIYKPQLQKLYLSGIYASGCDISLNERMKDMSNDTNKENFKNDEEILNKIKAELDNLKTGVISLQPDIYLSDSFNNIFDKAGFGDNCSLVSQLEEVEKHMNENVEKAKNNYKENLTNNKNYKNYKKDLKSILDFAKNLPAVKERKNAVRFTMIKRTQLFQINDDSSFPTDGKNFTENVSPIQYISNIFKWYFIPGDHSTLDVDFNTHVKPLWEALNTINDDYPNKWNSFASLLNIIEKADQNRLFPYTKSKEYIQKTGTEPYDPYYIHWDNRKMPIQRIKGVLGLLRTIRSKFLNSDGTEIWFGDEKKEKLAEDMLYSLMNDTWKYTEGFIPESVGKLEKDNNGEYLFEIYTKYIKINIHEIGFSSNLIHSFYFAKNDSGIEDLSYGSFEGPEDAFGITRKDGFEKVIKDIESLIKNYNSVIFRLTGLRKKAVSNESGGEYNMSVVNNFLCEDIKNSRPEDIKPKYENSEYRKDLEFPKTMFTILSGNANSEESKNKISSNVTEMKKRLVSIDKDLEEAEADLAAIREKFFDDGIICLTLGGEEARSNYGPDGKPSNPKYYKSLTSLFNSFVNQCPPYVDYKNDSGNTVKYNTTDETGTTIAVESDNVSVSRKMAWNIAGFEDTPKGSIPIIGFHYLRPHATERIRWYSWGTGNPMKHCVKNVNIETTSEFGMLNSAVIKNSNNGETTFVNSEGKRQNASDYFMNNVFVNNIVTDAQDAAHLQDAMVNGVKKGTIEILGDPSLRFQGEVQPGSYPIYLDIKLQKSDSWYEKDENGNLTPEASGIPCQLSGYYVITRINHRLSSDGYTTTLDVMSYPSLKNELTDS